MEQWVRLCGLGEAPAVGKVMEAEVDGVGICLANVNGELSAIDNVCPHRQAPLGQGWVEGEAVVCPWHSWTFSVKTGEAEYPVHERVDVFPVRVEGEDVLVNLELKTGSERKIDPKLSPAHKETFADGVGFERVGLLIPQAE